MGRRKKNQAESREHAKSIDWKNTPKRKKTVPRRCFIAINYQHSTQQLLQITRMEMWTGGVLCRLYDFFQH